MTWKSYDEIYEYIGRFCVGFEQYSRSMETCIRVILHMQGLTNESIQTILLTNHTAEPLRTLLQQLIGETMYKEEDAKLYTKIFNKLRDIITKRNDLIHSKWFVFGAFDKETDSAEYKALGEKLHASKEGARTKKFDLKKEELETLIHECREAGTIVSLLERCVMGMRDIKDCFAIKGSELEVRYEALRPDVIKV